VGLSWPEVLARLSRREALTATEAEETLGVVLAGVATPAQVGAFLTLLHAKGETADEVTGLARAMLDAAVALNANLAVGFLMNGVVPKRNGNTNAVVAPSDLFETSDGSVIIAVSNDAQFRSFAALIGAPELADDPRFVTNTQRFANKTELKEIISGYIRTAPSAVWEARCARANVPCGPIMSTDDLANDEHVRGRQMYVELDHPQRGKWYNIGMPIKLSASPARIQRSPLLGEHTEEILKEVLGWNDEEIAAKRAAGAFSAPAKATGAQ